MKLGDCVALAAIVIIVIAATVFIVRQKKKGVKCIGCPHSKTCNKCNQSCTSQK